MGKAFEKQIKTIENQGKKQIKVIQDQGQVKTIKKHDSPLISEQKRYLMNWTCRSKAWKNNWFK